MQNSLPLTGLLGPSLQPQHPIRACPKRVADSVATIQYLIRATFLKLAGLGAADPRLRASRSPNRLQAVETA